MIGNNWNNWTSWHNLFFGSSHSWPEGHVAWTAWCRGGRHVCGQRGSASVAGLWALIFQWNAKPCQKSAIGWHCLKCKDVECIIVSSNKNIHTVLIRHLEINFSASMIYRVYSYSGSSHNSMKQWKRMKWRSCKRVAAWWRQRIRKKLGTPVFSDKFNLLIWNCLKQIWSSWRFRWGYYQSNQPERFKDGYRPLRMCKHFKTDQCWRGQECLGHQFLVLRLDRPWWDKCHGLWCAMCMRWHHGLLLFGFRGILTTHCWSWMFMAWWHGSNSFQKFQNKKSTWQFASGVHMPTAWRSCIRPPQICPESKWRKPMPWPSSRSWAIQGPRIERLNNGWTWCKDDLQQSSDLGKRWYCDVLLKILSHLYSTFRNVKWPTKEGGG